MFLIPFKTMMSMVLLVPVNVSRRPFRLYLATRERVDAAQQSPTKALGHSLAGFACFQAGNVEIGQG
jgi:hypothetical protein